MKENSFFKLHSDCHLAFNEIVKAKDSYII